MIQMPKNLTHSLNQLTWFEVSQNETDPCHSYETDFIPNFVLNVFSHLLKSLFSPSFVSLTIPRIFWCKQKKSRARRERYSNVCRAINIATLRKIFEAKKKTFHIQFFIATTHKKTICKYLTVAPYSTLSSFDHTQQGIKGSAICYR